MGFNTSSSDSSSQSTTQQWPVNMVPSQYGAESFQALLESYGQQAQQAYAPYANLGPQAANQWASLLGLDPYDPMQGHLDRLGGLISQGGNIPQASFSTDGGRMTRPGTFGDVTSQGGSSKGGAGADILGGSSKGGSGGTTAGSEMSDYFNIPGRNEDSDFDPVTIGGRRRAATEHERRLVVQNQMSDYLRDAELAIADIAYGKDPEARQSAFDAANEYLNTAIGAANDFQSDDPYWQQFMGEYGQDLALFQKELANDFSADLPQQQTMQEALESTPGYQFRYEQGLKGAQTSLAARGLRNSGQALKELTEYGQGFASQEYDNALNRYAQAAGFGAGAEQQSQTQQQQLAQAGAAPVLAASSTYIRGPQSMHSQSSSQSSSSGFGVSF